MSDVLNRAAAAVRAVSERVGKGAHVDEDVELELERRLADEYAEVLGLNLPPHEQVARFKCMTEGAPVVERVPRRLSPA